jgi:hypothetical protein
MRFFLGIALFCLLFCATSPLDAYPLTLEQRERCKQYIPRSFIKLEAKEPLHVVALGDDVMGGFTPLPSAWESNNPLYSYVGVFLARLAREFFYPGSVHLLNPKVGQSAKLTDYLGEEISLENLTEIDGTIFDGLRHATTDAFINEPDLVLVQYGIYDAFGYLSIDAYKRALQEIIDAAKTARSDIIVFGPPLVNYGGGAMQWGVERPYATTAREIAGANGVLFIDLGMHLSRFGGGVDPDTHPAAAMEIVGDKLERIFHYGPELTVRERVHPSLKTHEFLGLSAFDDLFNGIAEPGLTYTAMANHEAAGAVSIAIVIRNQTNETKNGSIGALAVGGALLPTEAAQRFTVPPAGAAQVSFRYQRPSMGRNRDGSEFYFPMEPSDELGRFSFFVEDSLGSLVVDLPVRIGPVTAVWKSRQFVNVSDKMRVEWDLVNGSDKTLTGTFQVGMADRVGQPTEFSVSPLGTKSVFSVFDFQAPEGILLFQQDVWIQIEIDGKTVRFTREMEASRDRVLGEVVPMKSWSDYANQGPAIDEPAQKRSTSSATLRFDADQKALYLVASLQGISIPDMGDQAALQAKLFLDARPLDEVRTFGEVEAIEVYTKGKDGPGFTPAIPIGSFGNGYNMSLSPKGITSVLKTGASGERLLEVRIPRSYLHRHEWKMDSPDEILGFRLELTVADITPGAAIPFPAVNRYESNSATFAFEDRTVLGFHENDARGLSTLRLIRQPVNSWSVRIY